MMEEFKVSLDVAESELERFADSMDLDLDTSDMDSDDLTAFNRIKRRILRVIQRGHLVINEDGEAVYTPMNPKSRYQEPLTFHERTGCTLTAMDGKKKNQDGAKTYAMMAEMCKVHPKVFSVLVGTDIKVCEAIFNLLTD